MDGSDFARAAAVLQSFSSTFGSVNVHVANVSFKGYSKRTMAGGWSAGGAVPPKLALLDIGSSGARRQELRGGDPGLPDARRARHPGGGGLRERHPRRDLRPALHAGLPRTPAGRDWTTSNLFKNGTRSCGCRTGPRRRRAATARPAPPAPARRSTRPRTITAALTNMGSFVTQQNLNGSRGDLFAECAGLGSFEGVFSGTDPSATGASSVYGSGVASTHFQTENATGVCDQQEHLERLLLALPRRTGSEQLRLAAHAARRLPVPPAHRRDPELQGERLQGGDGPAHLRGDLAPRERHPELRHLHASCRGTPADARHRRLPRRPQLLRHRRARSRSRAPASSSTPSSTSAPPAPRGRRAAPPASPASAPPATTSAWAAPTRPASPTSSPASSRRSATALDDDCDGQVDENLQTDCYEPPPGYVDPEGRNRVAFAASKNVGICRPGIKVCQQNPDGSYAMSSCTGQVLPVQESCNGLDDDCDGAIDEPGLEPKGIPSIACYDGPPGTQNIGECRPGQPVLLERQLRRPRRRRVHAGRLRRRDAPEAGGLHRLGRPGRREGRRLRRRREQRLHLHARRHPGSDVLQRPRRRRTSAPATPGNQTCLGGRTAWSDCTGQVVARAEPCVPGAIYDQRSFDPLTNGSIYDLNCDGRVTRCPDCTPGVTPPQPCSRRRPLPPAAPARLELDQGPVLARHEGLRRRPARGARAPATSCPASTSRASPSSTATARTTTATAPWTRARSCPVGHDLPARRLRPVGLRHRAAAARGLRLQRERRVHDRRRSSRPPAATSPTRRAAPSASSASTGTASTRARWTRAGLEQGLRRGHGLRRRRLHRRRAATRRAAPPASSACAAPARPTRAPASSARAARSAARATASRPAPS